MYTHVKIYPTKYFSWGLRCSTWLRDLFEGSTVDKLAHFIDQLSLCIMFLTNCTNCKHLLTDWGIVVNWCITCINWLTNLRHWKHLDDTLNKLNHQLQLTLTIRSIWRRVRFFPIFITPRMAENVGKVKHLKVHMVFMETPCSCLIRTASYIIFI